MPRRHIPGDDPWVELEQVLLALRRGNGVTEAYRQTVVRGVIATLHVFDNDKRKPDTPFRQIGSTNTREELDALADALEALDQAVKALHEPAILILADLDPTKRIRLFRWQLEPITTSARLAPLIRKADASQVPDPKGGGPQDARARTVAGVVAIAYQQITEKPAEECELRRLARVAFRATRMDSTPEAIVRGLFSERNTPSETPSEQP